MGATTWVRSFGCRSECRGGRVPLRAPRIFGCRRRRFRCAGRSDDAASPPDRRLIRVWMDWGQSLLPSDFRNRLSARPARIGGPYVAGASLVLGDAAIRQNAASSIPTHWRIPEPRWQTLCGPKPAWKLNRRPREKKRRDCSRHCRRLKQSVATFENSLAQQEQTSCILESASPVPVRTGSFPSHDENGESACIRTVTRTQTRRGDQALSSGRDDVRRDSGGTLMQDTLSALGLLM